MESKSMVVKVIIGYLTVMNLFAFLSMWSDKRRARRGKWRIPERTLFLLSFLGGSVGALAGMYAFRHKTKHGKFVVGMPAILLIHLLLAGVLIKYFYW